MVWDCGWPQSGEGSSIPRRACFTGLWLSCFSCSGKPCRRILVPVDVGSRSLPHGHRTLVSRSKVKPTGRLPALTKTGLFGYNPAGSGFV